MTTEISVMYGSEKVKDDLVLIHFYGSDFSKIFFVIHCIQQDRKPPRKLLLELFWDQVI